MTIDQWHSWFDFIIDKTGSPYMTSEEKDLLFNRATISYITRYFEDNIRNDRAEHTVNNTEELAPLIYSVTAPVDAQGKVLYSDLETSASTIAGAPKKLMYVLNVARSDNNCVNPQHFRSRFVRHNDILIHKENAFKAPDIQFPTHSYFYDHLLSLPQHTGSVLCSIIVEPLVVSLDDPNDTGNAGANPVSSDMPEKTHNDILMLALKLSSISIRDTEFAQLTNLADAYINPPK